MIYRKSKIFGRYDSLVILEPFKKQDLFIHGVDYAKQAHLQLLLNLKNYPSIQGIIGNTSGTLDLAAMLGFASYSIHQFTNNRLSYQECRLYFQLAFMSVGALIDILEEDADLKEWVIAPTKKTGLKLFDYAPIEKPFLQRIEENKTKANYSKMFSITFFNKNQMQTFALHEPLKVVQGISQGGF